MPNFIWDDLYETASDSSIKEALEKAKDTIVDAKDHVSWKMQNIATVATEIKDRIIRGWDERESWDFGDEALCRAADICSYLRRATYSDPDKAPDEQYMQMLERCEKVFRAYSAATASMLDIMRSDVLDYEGFSEKMDGATENVLLPAWMWYGNNLLDPDKFICPDDPHVLPMVQLADHMRGRVTFEDVRDLPTSEPRRMAAILHHLAHSVHGYPEGYHSGGKSIPGKGEDWEDGSPILISLSGNRGWQEELMEKTPQGFYRQRKRKDIGLDWCAWVEDMEEASDFLSMYAEWNSPAIPVNDVPRYRRHYDPGNEYPTLREGMELLDPEGAREIDDKIRERFDVIWTWLGRSGTMLCD